MLKRIRPYLFPVALVLALGAVVLGFPYAFPSPSIDDLSRDCARRCTSHGALWKLVKDEAPASPKHTADRYSCRCL